MRKSDDDKSLIELQDELMEAIFGDEYSSELNDEERKAIRDSISNDKTKSTNKETIKKANKAKEKINMAQRSKAHQEFMNEYLKFDQNAYKEYMTAKLPTPKSMKKMLDEYIISQDRAKKDITSAIFNQQLLGRKLINDADFIIEKSNVMLLGPTGSGKTAMLQRLANSLGIPFVVEDITAFSSTGYVGRDTEQILRDLINRAPNKNGFATISGIVYLDEIDKLARKQTSVNTTADPAHMELQNNLLKMLEGTDVEVCMSTARHVSGSPSITLNTRNILFIAGGAFANLDKIVEARLKKENKSRAIGFGAQSEKMKEYTKEELYAMATVDDLEEYGMSRELLGRFPILTRTEALSVDTLKKILTEPKNSLVNQYKEMFDLTSGTELEFDDNALTVIANKAIKKGTGARALKGIMESILRDIMFEIPSEDYSLVKIKGNLDDDTISMDVYRYDVKKGKNIKVKMPVDVNDITVA